MLLETMPQFSAMIAPVRNLWVTRKRMLQNRTRSIFVESTDATRPKVTEIANLFQQLRFLSAVKKGTTNENYQRVTAR
jgi:hypothetical protein